MHALATAVRWLLVPSLAAAIVAVAVGFGGSPQQQPLRVGVVLPGQINDRSWNAVGYAGLKAVQVKHSAEIAYTENVVPATQAAAIRSLASRDFDIVYAHGGQYETTMQEIAKEFPETQFVTIAGTRGIRPNVNAYSVDFAEFFYVQGYIGAKLTKTGRIGIVGALQGLKNVQDAIAAWRLGAKAANRQVKTTVVYLKNNEDAAEGKAAAEALIAGNNDVVNLTALNQAIQGVIQAAKQANVWTNGEYLNLTKSAPRSIVTNDIYNWSPLYLQAADAYKADKLRGVYVSPGFAANRSQAGGFQVYAGKNNYNPRIPRSIVAQVKTRVIPRLITGKIKLVSTKKLAAPGTQ